MSFRYPAGLLTTASVVNAQYPSGVWTQQQSAPYQNNNVWASDAYFKNTTLLLHGDGTNGGQNNTFLDSSTNNFTITRNGNTTQGSFTPYTPNGYWGNYFNASASRLEVVNSNSSMIAQGTAFTLEAWVFINSNTATGNTYNTSFPIVCSSVSSSSASNGRLYSFGTTTFGFWDRASASWLTISYTAPTAQWFHFALVSTGTVFTLYINGTSVGSVTDNTTYYADSGYNFYIASYVGNGTSGTPPVPNMYLSNFRYTKAQVYTTTFTPSTTPLTAIANTTVLTCQSNRFIDNSTNAYTINALGGTPPSVQKFQPFAPTTAYSASVIGGSGYFDGSGDYLSAAQNSAFNFGTGAFTVEAFVYLTAYPSGGSTSIFSLGKGAVGDGTGYTGWGLIFNSTQILFYRYDGTETYYTASTAIPLNAWSHVVAVRNGSSNFAIYLNGTRVLSTTTSVSYNNVNSDNLFTSYWYSGGPAVVRYLTGYVSSGRIVAGTAVYDPTLSTLTVPTAPLTAISGTSLLMNYTNASILDNAMANDLETVGNAQISTSVVKYGTGSMYFDGTGDYLYQPSTPNLTFGSGDFTVEMWVNPAALSGTISFLIGMRPATTNGAYPVLYATSSGTYWYVSSANRISGSVLSTSTWTHLTVCRSGTSTKMFINGIQTGSTYSDSTSYLMSRLYIGASDYNSGSSEYLNGYIDDLRITKGVARYVTNFTPPIARMPNQ